MGKLKKVFGFNCKFNWVSDKLTKFHQIFDTKWFLKASICIKNIASNEYLLILFHYFIFMTFYLRILYFDSGHMDLPTCQNIGKEIVWGHEMMGCMLLFLPLTCAQGKSQYQCKWTKNCDILIAFNEKCKI